jgi:hypothetical protein
VNNYSPKNLITITGFILATDFSRHGKVMEIALETDDFRQYIVTPNQKGKELYDLLYSEVTVHGFISGEDSQGNLIIKVDEYEIKNRVPYI